MANTFVQIGSTVTVGSGGAASIDFSSIPSTYTDLVLKLSARTAKTGQSDDYAQIAFNGVSTNRSMRLLFGNGSTAGSQSQTSIYSALNADGSTASSFGSTEFYIPNYAGSTNKSLSTEGVNETNATTAVMMMAAGLWSSTAAINQITLTSFYGSNFLQYSTASLYGIKNS